MLSRQLLRGTHEQRWGKAVLVLSASVRKNQIAKYSTPLAGFLSYSIATVCKSMLLGSWTTDVTF